MCELIATFKQAFKFLLVFTIITGVIYPGAVTVLGQTLFSHEANGSLIKKDGMIIGSELIGQSFIDEKYFWARPSMTGDYPYNALGSAGSNQSPAGETLEKTMAKRVKILQEAHKGQTEAIPVDLVTASASGLDPHISVASAIYQAERVAKCRNLEVEEVVSLIKEHTQGRQLGFLGEERVNVVSLNLSLDDLE
ncbi:MAG: potassium-transporting ATPase subunit KdpC [Cellulosilyticaceae bacterium]